MFKELQSKEGINLEKIESKNEKVHRILRSKGEERNKKVGQRGQVQEEECLWRRR